MMYAWTLVVALASPLPGEAEVVRALSARHGAPWCEALEATLGGEAVAVWGSIAESYEGVPWVPVRAAACLARHAAAQPVLLRWMTAPELAGLADAALAELEAHEADTARAVELARAALAGPHRELVARRLQASIRPALRALVP
jgi:hypothetical protein